jgi:hypothetical protein
MVLNYAGAYAQSFDNVCLFIIYFDNVCLFYLLFILLRIIYFMISLKNYLLLIKILTNLLLKFYTSFFSRLWSTIKLMDFIFLNP